MLKEIFLISLVSCTLCSVKILEKTQATKSLTIAKQMREVTDQLFGRSRTFFDVIIFQSRKPHVNEIVKKFLGISSLENSLKVWVKKNFHIANVKNSALIFIEKVYDLKDSLECYFFDTPSLKQFLFFIENFGEKDFDETLEVVIKQFATNHFPSNSIGKIVHFTYLLISEKDRLILKSFEWWTEKACNQAQLHTINEFDHKQQKWLKPFNIPKKFTNFHGCKLRHFSKILRTHTLEIMESIGGDAMKFHPRIPEAIQKRNNFEKRIVKVYEEFGNFTAIRSNQDTSQITQVSDWFSNVECSIALFSLGLVSMYTPPEAYTNYEKMILPFDTETWICLIIVFCFSFLGIFVINQLPQRIKDIVYGRNVRMPSFNVLGVIFGIGQTKLPENNFGRILLMFFVIFCLIMRTAYQGVFFEMFTSDVRGKPPETYLDLKERDYTLYTVTLPFNNLDYGKFVTNLVPYDHRPKIASKEFMDLFRLFRNMSNPALKAAIITTEYDMKLYRAAYQNVPKTISEVINPTPYSICVDSNNFFADLNQDVSNKILSAGIPQYFFEYLTKYVMMPLLEPPQDKKVFSIGDLRFGFIIWLIACFISVIAFVCEIIHYKHIQRKAKNNYESDVESTHVSSENSRRSSTKSIVSNSEIAMVIIPSEYPDTILTTENVEEFCAFFTSQIDLLSDEEAHPSFTSSEYEKGFLSFTCADQYSADFLVSIVFEFQNSLELYAVLRDEMPDQPTFRSYISDCIFHGEYIKQRLTLQNKDIGLDASEWDIFEVEEEKLGGFSFMVKMDALSAKLVESKDGWMMYALSKIKFTKVIEEDEPLKECCDLDVEAIERDAEIDIETSSLQDNHVKSSESFNMDDLSVIIEDEK